MSFGLLMYISVRGSIVLVKKFILLSFSSERKTIGYILGLLFLSVPKH